jgi:hypothetical protein
VNRRVARGSDESFQRLLERVAEERPNLAGVSIEWSEGCGWRVALVGKDARRDIDLPGVRQESDESDFDDADTDVE